MSFVTMTDEEYVQYIKMPIVKRKIRIEFLYPDLTTQQEITSYVENTGGNIGIQFQNGSRRTCDIQLMNIDNEFSIEPNSIWYGQLFQVWCGIEFENKERMFSMGVFVVSNPDTVSKFSRKSISLRGVDRFSLLNGELGGQVPSKIELENGTNLVSAIQSILTVAGDTISPVIDTFYNATTIPYTITKDYDSTYGDILLELAKFASANMYYDVNGRLNFERGLQDLDDSSKPSMWDFTTNEKEYFGATATSQFDKVRNRVVVVGANINGATAIGIAENTNLTSNTNTSLIGQKTLYIGDENISFNSEALERAVYELKKVMMVQSLIKTEVFPLPNLDVNQVITITDEALEFEQKRFLIHNISFPLKNGDRMSIDCVDVTEIDFTP